MLTFPTGPSLNDETTTGGRTYRWNGEAWELVGSGIAGPTGPAGPTGSEGPTGNTGQTGKQEYYATGSAPVALADGAVWLDTDTGEYYLNQGDTWFEIGVQGQEGPTGPTGAASTAQGPTGSTGPTGALAPHASTHATGGSDAIAPSDIGAAPAASPTFTGDVTISDTIVHSGDTNTAIRFPAADTFTIETDGVERLRVDSSGRVGIGTASPGSPLTVGGTSEDNIRIFTQGAAASIFTIGRSSSTGALVFKGAQDDFSAYEFRSKIDATEKTVLSTNRLTGATRLIALSSDPASGNEAGDVYYNSTTNKLRVYNGTSWVDLH